LECIITTMNTNDANRYLRKYGAEKLSKTHEGRKIIEKAKEKYRIDLLQPGDPEFKKHWGKVFDANKLKREQDERRSKEMWAMTKERQEFEQRQRTGQGTDWKSKRL